MALEDHAVEHRQAARHPLPVKLLERAHGPYLRVVANPPSLPALGVRAQGRLRRPDNHPDQHRGAHWLRPSEARLR
jgi:hypothetical protein